MLFVYHFIPTDLTRMLATERDWDLLVWLWKGWRDATGKKIPKMYEEYVNLLNEAARLNGEKITKNFFTNGYQVAM